MEIVGGIFFLCEVSGLDFVDEIFFIVVSKNEGIGDFVFF